MLSKTGGLLTARTLRTTRLVDTPPCPSFAEYDEKFHLGGGAEAVDDEDGLAAGLERQVVTEDDVEEHRGQFAGGAERDIGDALFAVDAHA